jgi:hypothetical protein
MWRVTVLLSKVICLFQIKENNLTGRGNRLWITWDIQRLYSSDSCCYLILLFLCNGKLYCYMSYHRLWRPNICKYGMSHELRSLLLDLIPELILSQKCHIHMGPICNGSGVMSTVQYSTVNKLEKKGSIVHLLRYVVKCSYKFTVQHSSKLFEVSYICLGTFSASCDQRTSNLMQHCSAS